MEPQIITDRLGFGSRIKDGRCLREACFPAVGTADVRRVTQDSSASGLYPIQDNRRWVGFLVYLLTYWDVRRIRSNSGPHWWSCLVGCCPNRPVSCLVNCCPNCGPNRFPGCSTGCGSSRGPRCSHHRSTRCSTGRPDRCGPSRRPLCSPSSSGRCSPDCW